MLCSFIFCLSISSAQSGGIHWEAIDVSLTRLIENPQDYKGKYVRVSGFMDLDFQGSTLVFNKSGYSVTNEPASFCGSDAYMLLGVYEPPGENLTGVWRGLLYNLKGCKKDMDTNVT